MTSKLAPALAFLLALLVAGPAVAQISIIREVGGNLEKAWQRAGAYMESFSKNAQIPLRKTANEFFTEEVTSAELGTSEGLSIRRGEDRVFVKASWRPIIITSGVPPGMRRKIRETNVGTEEWSKRNLESFVEFLTMPEDVYEIVPEINDELEAKKVDGVWVIESVAVESAPEEEP